MIAVFLSAPYLANTTLNAPHLTPEIRLGALLLFASVINSAQAGVLSGFEDFKSIAFGTFYASLAESICMILGAYYFGVFGALVGFGSGYIIMTISYFFFIRKNMIANNISRSIKSLNKKDISVLYKFSAPAALSALMVSPVFWIVRTMLANNTDGFGELGIFEAADQWKIIILFIPSAISGILLPILTNTLSHGNEKSYWKALKYNVILNAGVTFILATLVSLFAPIIMSLYGKDFNDVWTLVIISYSTVFTSIASVVGISIASRGKMWIGFSFNFLWGLMFIGFTYVFLSLEMGARGLALALLCSYILHSLFQGIYIIMCKK